MLPATFTPEFLRNLELFKIKARRAYLGSRQGGHLSPKRGHGIEFSDFREYELGDNPRWIDWGVYARTDRLYVRRYQEEQNLSVLVVLDASHSMRVPAEDNKWESARDLALALSYVALMEQDKVVVAPLGCGVTPSYSGGRAIHDLGRRLMSLKFPETDPDIVREASRAVSRIKFPGVAVVISDLLMPFVTIRSVFQSLLSKNLEVTAIRVVGPHDRVPFSEGAEAVAVDSESGEEVQVSFDSESKARYQFLLDEHMKQVREFFGANRIGFAEYDTTQDQATFILNNLAGTGLLR